MFILQTSVTTKTRVTTSEPKKLQSEYALLPVLIDVKFYRGYCRVRIIQNSAPIKNRNRLSI